MDTIHTQKTFDYALINIEIVVLNFLIPYIHIQNKVLNNSILIVSIFGLTAFSVFGLINFYQAREEKRSIKKIFGLFTNISILIAIMGIFISNLIDVLKIF
jgi:hypothetical protein